MSGSEKKRVRSSENNDDIVNALKRLTKTVDEKDMFDSSHCLEFRDLDKTLEKLVDASNDQVEALDRINETLSRLVAHFESKK